MIELLIMLLSVFLAPVVVWQIVGRVVVYQEKRKNDWTTLEDEKPKRWEMGDDGELMFDDDSLSEPLSGIEEPGYTVVTR